MGKPITTGADTSECSSNPSTEPKTRTLPQDNACRSNVLVGQTPSWRRGVKHAPPTGAPGAQISNNRALGQPWVFVLTRSKEPFGMVHPAVARMWLKKGKARMHRMGPNVVRLICAHAENCYVRKVIAADGVNDHIGTDPGGKVSGLALVLDWKTVWTTNVEHRSNRIHKVMTQRSGARSNRRCRNKRKTGRSPKEADTGTGAAKMGGFPQASTTASNR